MCVCVVHVGYEVGKGSGYQDGKEKNVGGYTEFRGLGLQGAKVRFFQHVSQSEKCRLDDRTCVLLVRPPYPPPHSKKGGGVYVCVCVSMCVCVCIPCVVC